MIDCETKDFIKRHALSDSPNECCGLIVEESLDSLSAMKCRNVAQNPLHNFSIDPQDYLKASIKGKIKGTYHSHLEKQNFSATDKMNSMAHKMKYILYTIKNDYFSEFDPFKNKVSYLNKPFKIGVNDCFTLVRDYYRNNLKLSLPQEVANIYLEASENEDLEKAARLIEAKSLTYEDSTLENDKGKIVITSEKANFVKLFPESEEDLEEHDILIFGGRPRHKPYHMGVYTGNNVFVHHPRNKFATSETITKMFWKRLIYTYRYK